jgi:hypothetical protein
MNLEVGHRIGSTLGMVEEVDVTGDGLDGDVACGS